MFLLLSSLVSTMGLWLRIIQINDVYELDAFPNLQTLIQQHKRSPGSENGPDKTLVICAGDFLAPSLLSSLDKGAGMVDCLEAVGVTHVCLGNHETDVGDQALTERILTSKFAWINTNVPSLNEALGVNTVPHDVIEVSNGKMTKKVGILGLLTHDPSLYRPGAFGGAAIEPIIPFTEKYIAKFRSQVDVMIPMTHQGITEDRAFAQHFGGEVFPVVLGGHDHEPFDEVKRGARIVKAGMDAEKAAVIDLQWDDESSDESTRAPSVSVVILPTSDFAPDPIVAKRVQAHNKILQELERSPLFSLRNWKPPSGEAFSTANNRVGPSTGSTALTTMLRMGMRAHCAIVNAGSIRANQEYDQNGYFFWSDLKAEIPFPTGMVACYIPGRVLETTIRHSRQGARQTPPVSKGGYLHTCNNIQYNDEKQCIETIRKAPFNPDEVYLTAFPFQFFSGIDNHEPLLEWAKESGVHLILDSAIPAKMVLVEIFSALVWMHLGSFEEIDRDHDGVLKRDEVKARVAEIYGTEVADLVVDNIMAVADMNGDGTITPLEMMIVQFVATDMVDHVCTKDELKAMKDVAAKVLGKDPSHEDVKIMVEKIRDAMDLTRDGTISRQEMMEALGALERAELLK
jgi:2',3'-cyclic-nucleotide 2'-phosphodiesterase (5'-nucleotidase family)/Ca2+-binding EF-hand superfamily protein